DEPRGDRAARRQPTAALLARWRRLARRTRHRPGMIELSRLPRDITVTVGGRSEIPLPSYAGSGNAWSVTRVAGGDVARVWLESGEPTGVLAGRGDGIVEPPALALAAERAVVSGLVPGAASWRPMLARPFGGS